MSMGLFPVYIILLALGAKATWNFVKNIIPTSIGDELGFVIIIVVFGVIFLVAGPIVGIVTAVKYLMAYFGSKTFNSSNTKQ